MSQNSSFNRFQPIQQHCNSNNFVTSNGDDGGLTEEEYMEIMRLKGENEFRENEFNDDDLLEMLEMQEECEIEKLKLENETYNPEFVETIRNIVKENLGYNNLETSSNQIDEDKVSKSKLNPNAPVFRSNYTPDAKEEIEARVEAALMLIHECDENNVNESYADENVINVLNSVLFNSNSIISTVKNTLDQNSNEFIPKKYL